MAGRMKAQITPGDATFHCEATALDVRRVLGDLRTHLRAGDIREDDCGDIELALAEVLNNIVEHAYAVSGPGTITVVLWVGPDRIICEVRDQGAAMPDLQSPIAFAPNATSPKSLPEGGFGWSLIHALSLRLVYLRDGAVNRLILDFEIGTR